MASRDEAELLLRLLWSEEDEEEEDDAPPFTCPVAMSPWSRIVRTAVTAPEFGSILQANQRLQKKGSSKRAGAYTTLIPV